MYITSQLFADSQPTGIRAEPVPAFSKGTGTVPPQTPAARLPTALGPRTNAVGSSTPPRQPEIQTPATSDKRDPPPTRDLPPLPK